MPLVLLLAALLAYATGDYAPADDYAIRFSGRGASGTFTDLEGVIRFDPSNLTAARLDVRVPAATIRTGNNTKDDHARGEAWLHAEAHPHISFASTAFAKTTDGYLATGELTMRGVTRAIELPFTFTPTPAGGTFRGAVTVDRRDYGIAGSFGQALVADDIAVELVVPVVRK